MHTSKEEIGQRKFERTSWTRRERESVRVSSSFEPSESALPKSPCLRTRSDYCHVSSIKDGGALANDGRVKPGDKLMRMDGFDCMGVPRAVIKSRVLGPPNSEVVLLNFSATGGCSK